jgi:multiple sugar transport system permease protein
VGTSVDPSLIAPRRTARARVFRHLRKNALAYGLILPSIVLLALIEFYPLIVGLLEGFKYHNRLFPQNTHYNGIDNFRTAFSDPEVRHALLISLEWVGGTVGAAYVLGLVAALLLHQRLRLGGIYKTLILVPWVVPPIVAVISWQWILTDQGGPLDQILMRWHLVDHKVLWLADPHLALLSLTIVEIWQRLGFFMIALLASLTTIPDDLNEAAAIDGASRWRTFWHITFPLLLPVSITFALLQAIWTFNDILTPLILTGGGPSNATETINLLSYTEAFRRYDIGYGTSLAIIMMMLMLIIGGVQIRLQAKHNMYEEGAA